MPETIKKKRPQPRGGSRKGIPNKTTKALKDMILGALEDKGGVDWLKKQMDKHPGPFMALLGKVLPMTIAGDKDNPITITEICRRVVHAADKPSEG